MTIAIIDDDAIFQFLTHKLLKKLAPSAELMRFNNGQEALDFIRINRTLAEDLPELILLDINMPRLNGWQFLDGLRSLDAGPYQPAIYLVSSSTDPADVLKSQTYAELTGFLHKPLSMQQLGELLETTRKGFGVNSDR